MAHCCWGILLLFAGWLAGDLPLARPAEHQSAGEIAASRTPELDAPGEESAAPLISSTDRPAVPVAFHRVFHDRVVADRQMLGAEGPQTDQIGPLSDRRGVKPPIPSKNPRTSIHNTPLRR